MLDKQPYMVPGKCDNPVGLFKDIPIASGLPGISEGNICKDFYKKVGFTLVNRYECIMCTYWNGEQYREAYQEYLKNPNYRLEEPYDRFTDLDHE